MTFKQNIKPLGKGKYKVVDSDQTINTHFQGDLIVEMDSKLEGGIYQKASQVDVNQLVIECWYCGQNAYPEFYNSSRKDFIESADFDPLDDMSLRSHISVVSAVDPSYVWDYIKFFGQPIVHLYHFYRSAHESKPHYHLVFTDGWDYTGSSRYTVYRGSFFKKKNGLPIISDLMRYKTICYGQKVNADLFRVFVDNVNY